MFEVKTTSKTGGIAVCASSDFKSAVATRFATPTIWAMSYVTRGYGTRCRPSSAATRHEHSLVTGAGQRWDWTKNV